MIKQTKKVADVKKPEIPSNEAARLSALKELEILDTLEEQAYDDLTLLASQICNTPIALVSLIDKDRQWFKSHHGLDARETPREFAFCAHAIHSDDLFYVPDSEKDERFADNPLVVDQPHVKFYAGIPLKVRDKYRVGTLCVIDHHAHELSEEQKQLLEAIARQVETQLDLRLKVKELKVLDDMKNDFVAMVTHELRTPLTAMKGALYLLNKKKEALDDIKRNHLIETSYSNAERLELLVNDILDTTKITSGKLQLEKASYHINLTIDKCVDLLNEYFTKCKTQVVSEQDPNIPNCLYDENRIIQVLNNLLSNAAKFSPENAKIEIKSEVQDHQIVISIKDYGPGIPKNEQEQLFQKFSQIHSQVPQKISGTGLGLFIAKEIIELHGGTITYQPNKPSGSIFTFSLPINN